MCVRGGEGRQDGRAERSERKCTGGLGELSKENFKYFWGSAVSIGLCAGEQMHLQGTQRGLSYYTWLKGSACLCPIWKTVVLAFCFSLVSICPMNLEYRWVHFYFFTYFWDPGMLMVAQRGLWHSHWSGSREMNAICQSQTVFFRKVLKRQVPPVIPKPLRSFPGASEAGWNASFY